VLSISHEVRHPLSYLLTFPTFFTVRVNGSLPSEKLRRQALPSTIRRACASSIAWMNIDPPSVKVTLKILSGFLGVFIIIFLVSSVVSLTFNTNSIPEKNEKVNHFL